MLAWEAAGLTLNRSVECLYLMRFSGLTPEDVLTVSDSYGRTFDARAPLEDYEARLLVRGLYAYGGRVGAKGHQNRDRGRFGKETRN